MRPFAVSAVLLTCTLVCGVACGPRPAPESVRTSSASRTAGSSVTVNPARIERVRQDLPPGYEVVSIAPEATPISLWGFGQDWTADPEECGQLAAREVEPTRGWSASGPGGIVYAGVSKLGPGVPADRDDPPCEQWSVSGGHSVGTVTAVAAPPIEDAETAGMSTAVTTIVEGGTETRSHADTFTADLADGYYVFVSVVTDPGSPNPRLEPAFASGLLVKTVSALRG
ncbi:hypothetical protein BA059_02225 [Mycolicibacterium sp. (ex Dasyatis americana)]|nr:hypothetical protein BA059_02225 [Mycolicibacterium sp. (ex Dasyatis americana)]